MIITITSLRLSSIWKFFRLSQLALRILKQTKTQKGFLRIKTTGFGYDHYTMSAWETENDMENFARSGAHKDAMKESKAVSSEIGIYTYSSDHLPDWKEAKRELRKNGKFIRFS